MADKEKKFDLNITHRQSHEPSADASSFLGGVDVEAFMQRTVETRDTLRKAGIEIDQDYFNLLAYPGYIEEVRSLFKASRKPGELIIDAQAEYEPLQSGEVLLKLGGRVVKFEGILNPMDPVVLGQPETRPQLASDIGESITHPEDIEER